jgi:hypothetical protein
VLSRCALNELRWRERPNFLCADLVFPQLLCIRLSAVSHEVASVVSLENQIFEVSRKRDTSEAHRSYLCGGTMTLPGCD